MFFVFQILLLTVYFSATNNFILQRGSQRDVRDVKPNKDVNVQDVQNVSSTLPTHKSLLHIIQNITNVQSPNLKLNAIDKRLSDEILIKRHIHEKDLLYTSSMFKSTKAGIATPTLELKQRWPVVELLSESNEFKENSQYFDDFEKRQFNFFHEVENESKIMEFPPKTINNYDLGVQNNQSKDKGVGLRSLPISNGDDTCACKRLQKTTTTHKSPINIDCTRTTVSYSMMPYYVPNGIFNLEKNIPTGNPPSKTTVKVITTGIPKHIPMGYPVGIPVGVPMGIPAGYPAGFPASVPAGFPAAVPAGFPAGVPAGYPVGPPGSYPGYLPEGYPIGLPASIPQSWYQPNFFQEDTKHKKPSRPQSDEELYYDDDDPAENIYIHNDSDDMNAMNKKRKHDKKHKDDIVIDVAYDYEKPRDRVISWNSIIRDNREELVNDISQDIKTCYGDTVIKNCYCSSSSYGMKSRIVFLLLMLVNFC